jgi:hypothetical protein
LHIGKGQVRVNLTHDLFGERGTAQKQGKASSQEEPFGHFPKLQELRFSADHELCLLSLLLYQNLQALREGASSVMTNIYGQQSSLPLELWL